MSYQGNTPADKTLKLEKQQFSVSATTSYTLSHSVSDPQDIALFINNVRQNPNSSYTVSGTALTLSAATASTDTMYCVFLGRAIGTIGIGAGSVTKDKVDFISDGTGSGIISKGDGGSVDGSISLNCSQNSHHTRISSSSHSSYAGNLNFVLPNSHGSNGQFLKTDGSGNLSFASAGISMADQWRVTSNFTISSGEAVISSNLEQVDTAPQGTLGSAMTVSSGVFTFPLTGFYLVRYVLKTRAPSGDGNVRAVIQSTTNNASYTEIAKNESTVHNTYGTFGNMMTETLLDITDTSNQKIKFLAGGGDGSNVVAHGNSTDNRTFFTFIRLGDT